jgi:pSer/pThr/pTyr-binding forkhead associated (FHA) protein
MIVKIKVLNGKKTGTTFLVWKSPYVIGRHEKADLRISNSQVSVQHCSIFIRGNEVWVWDMDSTNGTFINDKRIQVEQRIFLGDQLQVGPALFEIIQEATGVIPDKRHDEYSATQLIEPGQVPPSNNSDV